MITLGKVEKLEHWATWHQDTGVNKKQGEKLAADVVATKNRLLVDALMMHVGRIPKASEIARKVEERREPDSGLVWVCWDGRAVAVRTEPMSFVKDRRYYVRWSWKTLPKTDN